MDNDGLLPSVPSSCFTSDTITPHVESDPTENDFWGSGRTPSPPSAGLLISTRRVVDLEPGPLPSSLLTIPAPHAMLAGAAAERGQDACTRIEYGELDAGPFGRR